MRKTNLTFNWVYGSLVDNAIVVFKKYNIPYQFNHFGELTADLYCIGMYEKITFAHLHDDIQEICAA